jgi:protein phosphatase
VNDLAFRYAARSEIGRVRRNNEDAGYASSNLLVVADGMGGHEAGELASAATVASVVAATEQSRAADEVLDLLADAVITSGEHIADVVAANRDLTGMGTTLTALALRGDRIAIAHVGDSRAYVYRAGELQQMTKDHTFVQTLVDSGEISKEQAAVHPRRNLMMRAIDGIHAVDVDLSIREAHLGDRFLICSDGLCGVIDESTIAECLAADDLTRAVTELIDAAMRKGGPDNITVVVADVIQESGEADAVVIGSASESDNQERLPDVDFPHESADELEEVNELQFVPTPRRSWLIPALLTLAVLLGGLTLGGWWLSRQWFVSVYPQTNVVAIYQGIPAAGLSRLVEVSELPVGLLPDFERTEVESTIASTSHSDAEQVVSRLQARADACLQTPKTPGCPVVAQ